jgi:hypothetical protein
MSFHRRISVVIVASLGLILIAAANVNAAHFLRLRGSVASDGTGLEGYKVSLLASFVDPVGDTRVLGSDTTDPSGEFEIRYRLPAGLPSRLRPILLVRAEKGPVCSRARSVERRWSAPWSSTS